MNPKAGPTTGGMAVTITGTGFPATIDSVRVGTGRLGSLVRASSTQLTGTTPRATAPGPVDVTVYTSTYNGTLVDTAGCTGCFTYLLPVGLFAHFSVTFLGAGFDSSRAVDINDSGSVVGTVWTAATGWRGRLWSNAGAATDLGALLPVALNNGNSVLGNFPTGTDTVPELWEDGAVRALGGFSAGSAGRWYATDINNHGQVALLTSGGRPYLWQNDALTPLQTDGSIPSALGRMNDRGEVAGSAWEGFCTCGVILSTGTPRWVGGGRLSSAVDINDAGTVVGQVTNAVHAGYSGGYLSGIGALAFLALPFLPTALNDSLQIIGEGSMWQDSVTASLTSLVVDSTWQVSNAVAINNRGQIAAYGVNSATGARGAIRLDPVATTSGSSAKRRR